MSESPLESAVRRYYTDPAEVAEYAAIAREGLAPFEAALVRRAFAPGARVLDVGCGAGREAVPMAEAGLRVVASDLVPAMVAAALAHAAERRVRLLPVAAGLGALPFRDGAFDGVAMLGQVLAHVPGRAARVAALADARRILRPGGRLALTTHNRRCHWKFRAYFAWVNPWRRLCRALGRDPGLGDFDRWSSRIGAAAPRQRFFFHMYDLEEARADLHAAGFEVREARTRAGWEAAGDAPGESDYFLGFIAARPEAGAA